MPASIHRDVEREMYQDWCVNVGTKDKDSTNLSYSPEAK